jgi:hypothetical protein
VILSKNLLSIGRTVGSLITLSKVKYADLRNNRLGSSNGPDVLLFYSLIVPVPVVVVVTVVVVVVNVVVLL